MREILLASSSPRRRALLNWAGFDVTTFSPEVDECRLTGEHPIDMAKRLADAKVSTAPEESSLVVAADTIVHMGGQILGKPASRRQARDHLMQLANKWHTVTTGVAVKRGRHTALFHCSTKVMLRSLTAVEMRVYLESGEADDKAGAYGIQGEAGKFVIGVEGSWTNVMGLPVNMTLNQIDEISV